VADDSNAHLKGLTSKERAFVMAYVGDIGGSNATRAAVKAGYAKGGSAARVAAHRALKRQKVQHAIEVERQLQIERLRLDKDRILREEACIALFDPRELFDPDTGAVLRPDQMPEHVARAIASVKVVTRESRGKKGKKGGEAEKTITSTTEVKLHDKGAALGRIGRYLGMEPPQDVNVNDFTCVLDYRRKRTLPAAPAEAAENQDQGQDS
jgi:phage terminase small subunit